MKDANDILRSYGADRLRQAFDHSIVSGGELSNSLRAVQSAESAEDMWRTPTPIVSRLPAVEPFNPRLLPSVLGDYVMDVADRQQAPPDFAAVAAICGLAAVLGNRVRIRPKQHDDWEVTPNLWGAIIGRPSAMKSPAMRSALAPVYAIQDHMREAWEGGLSAKAVDDALAALWAKDKKKKAEKAIRSGDREQARSLLSDLSDGESAEPPCPRLIVNDATVEKLGELLNENPRGLLLIRDELAGFLARVESEEYQSERAFYLEAFNGDGRFVYDRIGRGTIHIENCTMSMIGGVQPSRIAPLVRAALSGANNDGLIQRLQMVVWPDNFGTWTWVDRAPDLIARLRYEEKFKALHAIELGKGAPTVLRFAEEAQGMYREWMTEIQTEARGGTLSSTSGEPYSEDAEDGGQPRAYIRTHRGWSGRGWRGCDAPSAGVGGIPAEPCRPCLCRRRGHG